MKLKRITMQGFKSFAKKTEIDVQDGITAIVGPNGSGKSNIADAMRWVLGEQSIKNLRGNKMEDVIFAGTDSRKALGFSEVTVLFDNTDNYIPIDYHEVEITRRLFRSGESEYYINKNNCRLKDVRELFMDTGIGKEGYSIIGQGRIDEILSSRPDDRRNIFEEVAGIVKYKSRKQEAERKLERTENNLQRISDLIIELEKQHIEISSQAEITENYNSLNEKLKTYEINLAIKEIGKLSSVNDEFRENADNIQENLDEKSKEKKVIVDRFEEIKRISEEKKEIIFKLEEDKSKRETILYEHKRNKDSADEKAKHANKDITRLADEIREAKERLEKTKSTKESSSKESELIKQNISELYDKKDSTEKLYLELLTKLEEKTLLFNKIDVEYKQVLVEKADIESTIKSFNRLYEVSRETKVKREQEIKRLEQIIDETKLISKELESSIISISEEMEIINSEIAEDNKALEELLNKSKKLKDEEYKAQLDHDKNSSELQILKDMESSYVGFHSSVRELMKVVSKKENKLGVIGTFSELISVDEKHELAIEIALGSSSQSVVIEKDVYVEQLIDILKKNKYGRATFLPLNTIVPRGLDIDIHKYRGYGAIGLASELVSYDEKLKNVVDFLLCRIIIVDNLDNALRLFKKLSKKVKIVTLTGEVLNPGGSITGGSVGNSNKSGIISRKNKIKKLENIIAKTKANLETINNEIGKNSLEELNIKKRIDELTAKANSLNSTKLEKQNEFKLLITKTNSNYEQLELITGEINKVETDSNAYGLELEELQQMAITKSNSLTSLKADSDKLKISIETLSREKEKNQQEYNDYKLEMSSLENQLKNLNNLITEADEIISNETDRIAAKTNENKEIKSMIALNSEELSENKETIKLFESELELLEEDLSKYRKEQDKLINEIYSKQEELTEVETGIYELDKKLTDIRLKMERNFATLENYHNNLKEKYGIEYHKNLEFNDTVKNTSDTITEIKKIKERITEIGTVNLNAISEAKKLEERIIFTKEQYKDLEGAKNNLLLVIDDMVKIMNNQFVEKFNTVNEKFAEVFSKLFNGGSGELYLEDTKNVLSSGIEIRIQPPGKKLQNLSLLSGGEKALTAIALLFAIQSLKAVPFCILDEIDAALDESNIYRYTQYLRNYFENTQFILITHRKLTMEIADLLYGVSMEEKGVSNLLSVRLKDEVDKLLS